MKALSKALTNLIVLAIAIPYFLLDAMFATVAIPLSRWIAGHWAFARIHRWILSLRPYPTLLLFTVPVIVLEPVKPVALYLIGTGHATLGLSALAIGEILNAESLMLVPFGEGGPAAERGDFTIGGRMPINPSGGLESKGHPIGATGLGQIHELVTQLRGEAGARQVEGARIAIQENGGGLYGLEEAVVAVTLLAKP